jgi:hypothetical protein
VGFGVRGSVDAVLLQSRDREGAVFTTDFWNFDEGAI